jgi:hypothetical protein
MKAPRGTAVVRAIVIVRQTSGLRRPRAATAGVLSFGAQFDTSISASSAMSLTRKRYSHWHRRDGRTLVGQRHVSSGLDGHRGAVVPSPANETVRP